MATQRFRMHLEVPTNLVGPIIELVDNEGILVSVEPLKEKNTKKHFYTNGKRNKGVSGIDLLMGLLKDHKGGVVFEQLKKAFVEKGFSETSVSPILSKLSADGKIVKVGNLWKLK